MLFLVNTVFFIYVSMIDNHLTCDDESKIEKLNKKKKHEKIKKL